MASVIYYYDTDPSIEDAGLSLRRQRDPEVDFPTDNYRHDVSGGTTIPHVDERPLCFS